MLHHGKKWLLPILAIAAVMLVFGISGTLSLSAEGANAITSAMLTKDLSALEVKVSLNAETVAAGHESIYLFELLPYQSTSSIGSMTPLAQEKPNAEMSFKVPFDVKNRPRLFVKLIVAVKKGSGYEIIAPARYIDNIESVAVLTYDYPAAASKKGLQVQMIADAQELGISHTVINVPVNEYLQADKKSHSLSYVFYNQTYYFDQDKIDYLDHRIKVLSEAGVKVYIDVLLTAPSETMDRRLNCLYYDNAGTSAEFYAFNMQNQESVQYLEAFLTFLAERYTREDRAYGFAGSFIMGYEVNSNRNSNAMGSLTLDSYLNAYIAAFRVADTALRSVYANGCVYVSLGNNFNRESSDGQTSADPMVDYAGRTFLDAFNEKVKYAGNIPWRVAVNPYASDESNTSYWNDPEATNDEDTPYITMKNIGVLTDYLSKETFLYRNAPRRVLISEFGVSADPNTAAVSTQAAAIAYAYYTAVANPNIEALIYHRHVDHELEAQAGLYFGLWRHTDGSVQTPLSRKTAYNVFKYMDTNKNVTTTAPCLTMLGVNSWDKLIPGFKESSAQKRVLLEIVPVAADEAENGYSSRLLCAFSNGDLYNFYPSDNTNVVELRADTSGSGQSVLYAASLCDNVNEYMGVSSVFSSKLNLRSAEYIKLIVKGEAPKGVTDLSLMMRLYTKSGIVLEGVGQIKNGEWTTVVFPLDKFTELSDTADALKIWIKPYDPTTAMVGSYSLWLESVTLLEKAGFSIGTFLIILGVIFLLGVIAVGIYLFLRSRRLAEERRQANARREKARAEAYRRQQMQNAQRPAIQTPQQQYQQSYNRPTVSEEEFRAAYGPVRGQYQQTQQGQYPQGQYQQQQGQYPQGQYQQQGQYPQQRYQQSQYQQAPQQYQQYQQTQQGQYRQMPQGQYQQGQYQQVPQQGQYQQGQYRQVPQGQYPQQGQYQQGQYQQTQQGQQYRQPQRQFQRQPQQGQYPQNQQNQNRNG